VPWPQGLAELKVSPSALESALVGIVDVTSAAVERYEVPERTAPVAAVGPSEVQKRTGDRQIAAPDSTIRISVAIVDDLMSLVSELVLGRTRLQTLRSQLQENFPDDSNVANLDDAVGHLDTVVTDMQTTVMKARMLPVENVFSKFPRLVRDLTVQSGKQVSFTMSGNDTELDRSVIEQLNDPLVHLLRNALDHGVETPGERVANGKEPVGSIALSAAPMENHILIQVRDDGSGIDPAKVVSKAVEKGLITQDSASRLTEQEACELIFLPGLSTAKKITDISGRGVGMDIVKSTVDRMGGHVAVESTLGKGTTFSITLPLTLAIMQALLVTLDDAVFALPLNLVTEIQPMPDMQIQMLQGTEATVLRGMILPLLRLRQYFGCIGDDPMAGQHVVVTRVDGQILGLVVDRVIGEQEIVMKPLGRYIGYVRGLSGATILGDGRIGLLIDVAALRGWSSTQRVA